MSTQLPVASATEPAQARRSFASGLPVSVSKVPRPVLVLVAESTVACLIASLSDGAFGCGGASLQTASRNFSDFS